MIFRRILFVSLAAAAGLWFQPSSGAQQPSTQAASGQTSTQPKAEQSDKTFSTDVKVVSIFASVRDKKSQLVKDLTQDDFTIDEDGRPQTIRYFSKESDLPLTLGLLIDTSGSMRRLIETERSASYKFLDQVLREDKDVAFVIHFDYEVELLQDVTSSRKLLQTALSQLAEGANPQMQRRDPNNPNPNGGYGGGGYGRRGGGGTALYDSILLASNEVMKKQTGRKAIILLTDGEDNGSKTTMTDAISAAQRADTMVYAIRFSDEQANQNPFGRFGGPGMGRRGGGGRQPVQSHEDGKKVLERIAKETGGGYFEGGKKQSLDEIYREIQDELRGQYSLGYTPDKNTGPGYRTVRVLTKNKNLVVQARDGYYAEK
jgi:VWFA-related protein